MHLTPFLYAFISIPTFTLYNHKFLAPSNRGPIHLERMSLSIKYPLISTLVIHLPNVILSQVSIPLSPRVTEDLLEPASDTHTLTPPQRRSYP
jgi:hypothetical protein